MEPRSYLYVPGDQPGKLAKATDRGADALIFDLEDAVADVKKADARALVTEWLRSNSSKGKRFVRVNNTLELLEADLAAAVSGGADGVFLPKATESSLADTGRLLDRLEQGRGSAAVRVVAQVETAASLVGLTAIAAGPRVAALSLGEADLAADLGMDPSVDGSEWIAARSYAVWVSAAATLSPPIGGVDTDFEDLDTLRVTTDQLRRLGFGSRTAIHPAQVLVINEVFTPSAGETEEAARLLERHEQALTRGDGVFLDDQGRMVDKAVVRRARRIVERGQSRS